MVSAFGNRSTVRLCQMVVAREYELTLEELLSKTRRVAIARPRQIAMYLATQLSRCSLPDLGRRFGGMNHTTVMYSRDRIAEMMAEDPELAAHVAALARRVMTVDKDRDAVADPELAAIDERLRAVEAKVGA